MDTPLPPIVTQSLVDRCRRGDREAWRELVESYSRYVYALRGWIAQVTRNLCTDHVRREHPHEELSDETVTDLDERLTDLDEALVVRQALTRLPPGCADILDRGGVR